MAKSEIAMSDAEMTAEIGDLDPRGRPEPERPEPRAKAAAKVEDEEPEYVGPDEAEGEAEKPAAKDKPAKDAKGKAEPDKKAEGDKSKKPDEKPDTVPHQALHAEREAHKATRAEMARMRADWEGKFNVILGELTKASQERQAPKAEEPEPEPDPDQDPIGHGKWLRKQFDELKGTLSQRQQQEKQLTEQQRAEQWYTNAITTAEQTYASQVPDYYEAAAFLRRSRAEELAPLHGGDPAAINQVLNYEAMQYAAAAIKQGQSPAAWFYALARRRGYQPKQAAQQPAAVEAEDDAEQPNGKTADGAAQIERLAKAQDAAESLSGAGGSAPGNVKMSFDSIDRMSQKEIEAWVRATSKRGGPEAVNKALARMMGAGQR